MFSCGWLPPMGNIDAGFIVVLAVGLKGFEPSFAHKLFTGVVKVAWSELPTGVWNVQDDRTRL